MGLGCDADLSARHSTLRAAHITPHAYQPGYGYNPTSTQQTGPSSQFGRGQQDWQNAQGSTALVSSDGGNSTALKAKEQTKMVQVRFWLKFHVDYGQVIRIIGGHDQLGECQPARLVQSRRIRCVVGGRAIYAG